MRHTLVLIAVLCLCAASVAQETKETRSRFKAPVQLTVEGKPLNESEAISYPTPTLFDIDNDGARELVIGDLWGTLRVYEKDGNTGSVAWKTGKILQAYDGRELKVSNW